VTSPLGSALLLLLCSALVFGVQPLAGHEVLPRYGGSASVWVVCLVVFQTLHAGGSFYAHLLLKFIRGRSALLVHAIFGLTVVLWTPVVPAQLTASLDLRPEFALGLELLVRFGAPFLLLAGTVPLVLEWRRRIDGDRAHGLYRFSNIGSFIGLLLYVGLVDPSLDTGQQGILWFVLVSVVVAALGVWCWGQRAVRAPLQPKAEQPSPSIFACWTWWTHPCLASVLMAATTTHLTRDVAPIPMLWVAPLGLFLLAFTLGFDPRIERFGGLIRRSAGGALVAAVGLLVLEAIDNSPSLALQVFTFLCAMFLCVLHLTRELFRSRPIQSQATPFYLAIAMAGTLGSSLVAFVAPLAFAASWELHLGLIAMAVVVAQPFAIRWHLRSIPSWAMLLMVGAGLSVHVGIVSKGTVDARRSFYGSMRVVDVDAGTPDSMHVLVHGRIEHGMQFKDVDRRAEPTSYYGAGTGAGLAVRLHPARRSRGLSVGVVGLGVGTLATWARPEDSMKFYEVDDVIVDLARDHFSYLEDCEGDVEVVVGDARVQLQAELETGTNRYDVLVLDAFSGDAVPTHLLTVEAFQLYRNHLKPDGIVVVNTTNRYLFLAPVAEAAAAELGWNSLRIETDGSNTSAGHSSEWTVLTRNSEFLEHPEVRAHIPAVRRPAHASNRWTDARVRTLQALLGND
jgi:hypothetical protein